MPGPLSAPDLVQLYRATIRPLYRFVSRRVGGDVVLAEDLVSDTWTRAIQNWALKGAPREPLAWLTRVARNALISHYRRTRPELVDPAVLDRLERDDGRAPDDPEAAAAVNWALGRLRRAHAELLEEFYFADRSIRDIARARGLSERAVEGRLRRARQALKKHLERIRPRATSRAAEADGATAHVDRPRTP